MWQRSGNRSRKLLWCFFSVGKAAGITGVWCEIHGRLVITLFSAVSMLYKTNKTKITKNNKHPFSSLLHVTIFCCVRVWQAASRKVVISYTGHMIRCWRRQEWLSDWFAHVEQFSVKLSYRTKQGTHGMPWRRREKRLCVWLHLVLLQRGKTNRKYIGCSSTLHMLYSWREEVQLYKSLYIYTCTSIWR